MASTSYKITSENLIHCSGRTSFNGWRNFWEKEVEWNEKTEINQFCRFLSIDPSRLVWVTWPLPSCPRVFGFKERSVLHTSRGFCLNHQRVRGWGWGLGWGWIPSLVRLHCTVTKRSIGQVKKLFMTMWHLTNEENNATRLFQPETSGTSMWISALRVWHEASFH